MIREIKWIVLIVNVKLKQYLINVINIKNK